MGPLPLIFEPLSEQSLHTTMKTVFSRQIPSVLRLFRRAAACAAFLSAYAAAALPQSRAAEASPAETYLISLTPEVLYEVDPKDYVLDPDTLGGAKLFYAVEPDLHRARVRLVVKYEPTLRQELAGIEARYLWGRLDNLKPSAATFWGRPSTGFHAWLYPEAREGKLAIDFNHWHKRHWTDYPALLDAQWKKWILQYIFPNGKIAGAPNFTGAPWNAMFERPGDLARIEKWLQIVNKPGYSLPEKVPYWWIRDWEHFLAVCLESEKRPKDTFAWTSQNSQLLNASRTQYDGFLYLKNEEALQDAPKAPFPRPAAGAGTASFRMVPFNAGAQFVTKPDAPKVELPRLRPVKAVVITDGKRIPPPFRILAVMCDWEDDSSLRDGITINREFSRTSSNVDDNRVPRAEYRRIDWELRRSGKAWEYAPGDMSPKQLLPKPVQSHVAYRAAGADQICRVLLAVAPELGNDWTFTAEPEIKSDPDRLREDVKDAGTYHQHTLHNLAPHMTLIKGSVVLKKKGLKLGNRTYDVYQADMEYKQEMDSHVRCGYMQHLWMLVHQGIRHTDITCIENVYTIIGESTWPVSGDSHEIPSAPSKAVRVWVDALDVFTKKYVNDVSIRKSKNMGFDTNEGLASSKKLLSCITGGVHLFGIFNGEGVDSSGNWSGRYSSVSMNWDRDDYLISLQMSDMLRDINASAKHDTLLLCAEASGCLAVLPRLCGFRPVIRLYGGQSQLRGGEHSYVVKDEKVFDPSVQKWKEDPNRILFEATIRWGRDWHDDYRKGYVKVIDLRQIEVK